MQQGDQTVLSLRPGGGRGRLGGGSRFESSSSSTSSSLAFGSGSADLPFLRPHGGAPSFSIKTGDSRFEGRERVQYTRDQLLQLRELVEVPDEILKLKREIDAEFLGEDQSWGRGENNPVIPPQNRYSEPDNRDWRERSAKLPASGDERSWEALRDRQQEVNQFGRPDQQNSHFSRTQNDVGGPAPTLVKAEVPWSARRGTLSDNDRVLKTVKGYLLWIF